MELRPADGLTQARAFDQASFDAAPAGAFARWASGQAGRDLPDYGRLWRWSVDSPGEFWEAVWRYFDVIASQPYTRVRSDDPMPGTKWFAGARLNYADQVLRHRDLPGPAVVAIAEDGTRAETGWEELAGQVTSMAATLRDLGVVPGDRVAGYLTNGTEAVVSFLASAAVGATWAGCGPDYGAAAAADRLAQLSPALLVATAAYEFGGKVHDRRDAVRDLAGRLGGASLPVIEVRRAGMGLDPGAFAGPVTAWEDAAGRRGLGSLRTEQVAADHPLWVLFSSGTTGIPKGIVHGHAGVLLCHLSFLGFSQALQAGSVFFWYTTTNWMMWNLAVSALLTGSTTVLYEGSPSSPTIDRLWRIVGDEGVTVFGTSPGHLQYSADAGLRPGRAHDLSRLRHIGVTGAPVPPAAHEWVAGNVGQDVPLASSSGGTDVVSAFVSWAPGLPAVPGEIPGPVLGVAVDALDEAGNPVIDQVGELVVTRPMPSMPVSFWNDPDGSRYRDAYFGSYPGIWRHGDWVTRTSHGSYVIHGRSDSTLNRGGVRIGSADLYRVVEAMPQVAESLVLGVELPDGAYRMPMFLVLAEGAELDEELRSEIRERLREEGSPRHVPDEYYAVPAIPHTKTGKKLEVPIKRILQGADSASVLSEGAVDQPALIAFYVALAQDWQQSPTPSSERA